MADPTHNSQVFSKTNPESHAARVLYSPPQKDTFFQLDYEDNSEKIFTSGIAGHERNKTEL